MVTIQPSFDVRKNSVARVPILARSWFFFTMTDADVLPAASALDEAELVRVLEDTAPALHALAARMLGDGDDARDAVQEAWIRAWGARTRLRDARAAAGWTRTIVVRECLRALRWRAVRRWSPFQEHHEPIAAADPEAQVGAARLAARARVAAAALPPRQRLCWGLRFDEGWSVAEIAEATGLGVDTVKTHLSRALVAVQGRCATLPG